MNYAVKKYGTNSLGLPEKWPSETADIGTETSLPAEYPSSEGWIFMTQATLDAHKASHQSDYDTYQASQKNAGGFKRLRGKRDQFLRDVDWTQLPDSQLLSSKVTQYQTYRQALRDLPGNTSDPNNPTWPIKPA